MTLHVFNNPTGDRTADDGINVWVTEVPADYTDDDVKYNVEKWAADGDKTAQIALEILRRAETDPEIERAYPHVREWRKTFNYSNEEQQS